MIDQRLKPSWNSSGATQAMGREGGSFPSPCSTGKLSVSAVNSPLAIPALT